MARIIPRCSIAKYLKYTVVLLIIYLIVDCVHTWKTPKNNYIRDLSSMSIDTNMMINKVLKSYVLESASPKRSFDPKESIDPMPNDKNETQSSNNTYNNPIVKGGSLKQNLKNKYVNLDKTVNQVFNDKTVNQANQVINNKNVNQVTNNVTVNPIFNGDYLLNNVSVCPDNLTIIIVVHTAPDHFIRRQNIRTTYGSSTTFLPFNIRTVFLIGRVKTVDLIVKIMKEHIEYGDIIQGNFIDTYHNLTYKAVMGLHWVSHYCSKVKYVVKVDDDVVFDMWKFLEVFPAHNLHASKAIFCRTTLKGIVPRKGKWTVPKDVLVGYSHFPYPFCHGMVMIYSGDTIPLLYRASYTVSFFWLDDVFVTGMLANKAGGIKIISQTKDLIMDPRIPGFKCLREKGINCHVLAVTVSEDSYNATWFELMKRHFKTTPVGQNSTTFTPHS
ncbi:beta-1,3-galactosyltransferase 1 [Patella vulgata]|uniref:beta-1,3-galactosyltransferase 1 n=1 Tax=Patella vulgata TaxID=6465 RepID=UPI0024A9750F|nr:beta-1,3-galactosyltransferase 1 [Patella vulgata]XP_050416231.2 beta-1,3-galactosyltransferase 1 [Patella vulgata]